MTPAEFHAAFRPCADQVATGTNIDPIALLAQWANETAWGTVVVGNNLGNIRDTPTSFARYPSLDAFAAACIATYHNGFYPGVLAATNAVDQLAAICASPWSSGHYGGSLQAYYSPLEGFELTPLQDARLINIERCLLGEPPLAGVDYLGLSRIDTQTFADLQAQLAGLQKAVAAIPGGGLTLAQAQELTDILAGLRGLTLKAA
jgi:hypothetical protein